MSDDLIEFPWKWSSFGFGPNEPRPTPTRESIAAFKEIVAADRRRRDEAWRATVADFNAKKERMLTFAKEIGFPLHRDDRTKKKPKTVGLDEALAPFFPSHTSVFGGRDYDYQIRAVEEWLTKKEAADRAKTAVEAEMAKLTRAILYLSNAGLKLGVDFTAENAIREANARAAIEAEKAAPEFYDDFSGKNCEDCPGWTKGERRCECGNRRVGLVSSGDFEDMTVYPEAW